MATPHWNSLPTTSSERPSTAQEVYLLVYHRCLIHHLRVLDAEIFKLETGSSCSELLYDVITNSQASPGSRLLDKIFEAHDKRQRIYGEFQRNLKRLGDLRMANSYYEAGSPASANSAT